MRKKKPQVYFALWNFDTLHCVEYQRKRCRKYANRLTGGKPEADRLFRSGALRIGKVTVKEVR